MKKIIIKKNREKSLLRRHPWIFSGAIKMVEGSPSSGETVELFTECGQWLACGSYSPSSQITVKIWSFDAGVKITPDFFRERIKQALVYRRRHLAVFPDHVTACRLIAAEADGLPGLIVDRYGEFIVCQFLAAGAEFHKQSIVDVLAELIPCRGIYERSDVGVRQKEGLPPITGLLRGEEPPEKIAIRENAIQFFVDVKKGHKTGFYLDQRENREYLFNNNFRAEQVLNCFAYTGGFGVAAASGGAGKVINVDSSAASLELAAENMRLNNISDDKYENVTADVFSLLRKYRAEGRKFDIVILDPPKFVESQYHLEKACRGYKDINILAFQLLKPGGSLYTFSCSGLLPDELFQKIVADAALDAGRNGIIVRRFSQAPDHPTALNFPESHYLKGLLVAAE